jgi:hypothetical protein
MEEKGVGTKKKRVQRGSIGMRVRGGGGGWTSRFSGLYWGNPWLTGKA